MDLLSISKCPARAFNRSKYCRKSFKNIWIYMSSTTILNIIKTSPTYISFFHFIYKKQSRVQKWICYQSLNVQQEPLTDQILKKINTGCLDLYELNNNLEHNQNIPEIHILFSLHLQKKQSRVQKWICYQSLNVQQEPLTDQILKKINTGCLDLYDLKNNLKHKKTSQKYISFLHFIYKKNKVGFKNGSVINL